MQHGGFCIQLKKGIHVCVCADQISSGKDLPKNQKNITQSFLSRVIFSKFKSKISNELFEFFVREGKDCQVGVIRFLKVASTLSKKL